MLSLWTFTHAYLWSDDLMRNTFIYFFYLSIAIKRSFESDSDGEASRLGAAVTQQAVLSVHMLSIQHNHYDIPIVTESCLICSLFKSCQFQWFVR